MAIKKLQNDYTTPEQSKRLLELGVPADSADCVLENLDTAENGFSKEEYTRWIIEDRHVKSDIFSDRNKDIFLPCWSVGRLIEIYVIARGVDISYLPIERGEDMVKYLIRLYEEKVKDLDFSKLEE